MDQLSAMRTLVRVIDTGSFSAAARDLGIGQPAVSKSVAQLEQAVGVRLLARTTRGLSPTDAGQRYYERAVRVLEETEEATQAARGAGATLKGRLRISTAVSFGRLHVLPHLPDFMAQHPELDIDMVMEDRPTDLIEEGVDVALRLGLQPASGLVGSVIGVRPRFAVSTPAFFERHGVPAHPSNLEALPGLETTLVAPTWTFRRADEAVAIMPRGRLRVSAGEGVRGAVLSHLAFAIAAEWAFPDELADGSVHRVLTDWTLPVSEVHALFPAGRHASARARAFVTYMETRLRPAAGHLAR